MTVSFVKLLLVVLTTTQVEPQPEEFHLLKRGETILYRPSWVAEPFSKSFKYHPFFCRAPTGEIFMVEMGSDKKGMAYFFTSDGKLRKKFALKSCCGFAATGKPGSLNGISKVFLATDREFGTVDNTYRLSLWDLDGNLTFSMILPSYQLKQYHYIRFPVFNRKTLVSGLVYMPLDSNLTGSVQIYKLDYENSTAQPQFYPLRDDADSLFLYKGAEEFLAPHVSILSNGKIAYTHNLFPDVYLVSDDRTMLIESSIPPHYRSFLDAESLTADMPRIISHPTGRRSMSDEMEQWVSTWTHSYPVYEYSGNRLLVPRVLYPTVNLDIYSYTDTNITYHGYASTEKEFLFADSSGVYLLEEKDSTRVVVGVYSVETSKIMEGISRVEVPPTDEEFLDIKKVLPDPSDDCQKCSRKKYRGRAKNIRKVKLLATDSTEYLLADSLASGKGHLILFAGSLGYKPTFGVVAAEYYLKEYPDYEFVIVYTHPYPEELKESVKLIQMQTDYRILVNIDEERLKPLLKTSMSILLVSKDGKITASADYPRFEIKNR